MRRDKRGRILPNHRYRLMFDNGPDQFVSAPGPTEAVARRKGERLPYQINDETAIKKWLGDMRERALVAMEQATADRDAAIARRDDFTPRWLARADTEGQQVKEWR